MATLWETVTASSNLPIAPNTTFWDHINNQKTGGESKTFIGSLSSSIGSTLDSSVNLTLTSNLDDLDLVSEITNQLESEVAQ